MDFAAQVQLMRETQLFVGVHGANLVNTLFMQPGSLVVEIMNTQLIKPGALPNGVGAGAALLLCPPSRRNPLAATADSTGYDADQNDADLRVDAGAMAALLHRLLPTH